VKQTTVPALVAALLLLALSACAYIGYTDGGGDPRNNQQADVKVE
jgi:hypothetical protein